MSGRGYLSNLYVHASAIVAGGDAFNPATYVTSRGFNDPPIRNGPGDYSLFLHEALDESNCQVLFTDHRQAPIPADTIFGYSRPSVTEIRVVAASPVGVPADRDFDVVVIGRV